jgi:hypothetical protein
MAIKVLGVPGKKLVAGLQDAQTQDFSMIQGPAISFGNSDGFMFFTAGADRPLTLLPRAMFKFGPLKTMSMLRHFFRSVGQKVPSLATLRYWSAVPIQFGDHAVKYSATPHPPLDAPPQGDQPIHLGDELKARLKKGPIQFQLSVQFYCDAERTPIEDASVEWREEDSPFVPMALVTLPAQDLDSAEGVRQQDYVETLAFDPWHAPTEFRPLGDIMRARGHIYRFSTEARKAASEPGAMEKFDCLIAAP